MILTIRDVEHAVCLHFQISQAALREKNPKRVASRPRQIAMYLARELTGASYPRLGQYFQRDHTSVLVKDAPANCDSRHVDPNISR